jgi:hypothetical protein
MRLGAENDEVRGGLARSNIIWKNGSTHWVAMSTISSLPKRQMEISGRRDKSDRRQLADS